MNLDQHKISERARLIMNSQKHFSAELTSEFSVSLDGSGKILTLNYHFSSGTLELLLAEVLAIFSQKKSLSEIWASSFREAESFLRDENHLAALGSDVDLVSAEGLYTTLKGSLIAAVAASLHHSQKTDLSALSNWNELTLAHQNAFLMKFLTPFKEALGWELVLYSEGILQLTKTPKALENSALEHVLEQLCSGCGKVLPMKVVAVE